MVELDYKTIVNLLPDIIYRIDPEGLFTYINESIAILGYDPDDLAGKHFSIILHPDDRVKVQRKDVLKLYKDRITPPEKTPKLFDERRTENRATRDLEVRLINNKWKDDRTDRNIVFGKLISVGMYHNAPGDRSANFCGTMGIIRDITNLRKSEDSLVRAEKHYRSLIENSTDIISIIATDGTILFESPSLKRVLGYNPIERIGEQIFSYVHPDDISALKKILICSNNFTEEIFHHQCRIKHINGSWMMIETNGKRVLDDNKILMCSILNSRDITELTNKETECRNNLEQSRAIIDTVMDAILVLGQGGEIVEVNPEAIKMYGYAKDEFFKLKYQDITNSTDNALFDSFKSGIMNQGHFQSESINSRKDGNTFDIDIRGRHIFYRGSLHFLAVIRDITPKKIAVEALRQSEEKYRAIAENTSDIIWIVDLQGNYKYVSPAVETVRGYLPEELLYQNFAQTMEPESKRKIEVLLARELELEKNGQANPKRHMKLELQMRHKDESIQWTEISASFLRTPDGQATGILGISRDITDRKKIETELTEARKKAEDSEKLKTSFLANMSHEIRTPMNSVIGYADLMCSSVLNETQKEYMSNIKKSGTYLLKIIEDILDLSKIESGQLDIEKIPCDFRAIFDDIRSQSTVLVSQSLKDIDIRESISPSIPRFCLGDPTRIKQVMTNLIGNAIKFTTEGFIEYGINIIDNGFLEFYVRDTGIGILPDDQEKIFMEFHQAESGTRRKYGGTGLGLSISKSLVGLMGGKIYVQSKVGEGHGSTFYFTIPFCPVENSEMMNTEEEESWRPERPHKILIAEDNYLNQKLAHTVLEKFGYTVIAADDGREAVSKFKSDPDIDLILMDIQMPVLDGVEATRLIRSIEQGLDRMFRIPIIALTAHGLKQDIEQCIESGCNDYIIKPINQALLKNLLKKYLK